MKINAIATGKNRRTQQTEDVFAEVPPLPPSQRALLKRWLASHTHERAWQSLLETAGADHLATAEILLQTLLETGVVQVKQVFRNTRWWPQRVLWRDLPRLQKAMGLPSADERASEKQTLQQQLQALGNEQHWAAAAAQSCLVGHLPLATLQGRNTLLQALLRWHDEQRFGVRQDFALLARPHTKAISTAEWTWMEAHLPLEELGIARFAPVLWLGGALGLQGPAGATDLSLLGFAGLPAKRLAAPLMIVRRPTRYWLLENRASFERCVAKADAECCVIWLPGRPSTDWLTAMQWLLDHAPAPAEISCDPDPAGIEIALTAGQLWHDRGLSWQCANMAAELWAHGKTLPLNGYDQQVLARLAARTDLPQDLATLRECLIAMQCKAEQEGWL